MDKWLIPGRFHLFLSLSGFPASFLTFWPLSESGSADHTSAGTRLNHIGESGSDHTRVFPENALQTELIFYNSSCFLAKPADWLYI